MAGQVNPLAGTPAPPAMLLNVPRLVTAYYTQQPDWSIPTQRIAFGTSGHRGNAFDASFNEWHVLAATQAICRYRKRQGIDGPLFLGIDTHALSEPAYASTLEVLAAHGVDVMLSAGNEYTPTPAVSHAILAYNRGRARGLADGIVLTPSHNPPESGGLKYNPPHGGPAGVEATTVIESMANTFLKNRLRGVKRLRFEQALCAATTHRYDFLGAYIGDLGHVIDLKAIRDAGIRMGVDPLGGAGVRYWQAIAERHRLDLSVINDTVDPTFRFLTLDWDGRIRMDPSSPYAMRGLIGMKDRFDIAFACDTDHDRHGIVTPSAGLLPADRYLAVVVRYLFRHRPAWRDGVAVGKTMVSSRIIDRVTEALGRPLYETPVGFKWFVAGLHDGRLGVCGEESAGTSFLRRDGTAWTTDKDGIAPALLSAEITAREGRDPGLLYQTLEQQFGASLFERQDTPVTPEQKNLLARLSPQQIHLPRLVGEPVEAVLTHAPGNDAPLGGFKVIARNGWFAVRPSGTENLCKLYAESFAGSDHLHRILEEARHLVAAVLTTA
jgi:phosphoglucomutase